MKAVKYIKKGMYIMAIFSLPLLYACEKFLEEEAYNSSVGSLASRASGLEYLVNGCYVTNKIWYGKEYGYDFSDIGTDIYTYGGDHTESDFFRYSDLKQNSLFGRNTILWVEFYKGINACNTTIGKLEENIPNIAPDLQEQRLSEVRFLRALYYWIIVETWGGVHLRTEPVLSAEDHASRSPVDSFYNQIFRDLNFAANNIKYTQASLREEYYGRVTKEAVIAFRARMALTKASYIRKGQQAGDMARYYQMAYDDAMRIINNSRFRLWDNYADLWNFDNNENNPEVIWIINYSKNIFSLMNISVAEYDSYIPSGQKEFSEREGGHHGHLMWGMDYRGQGMRRDLENGRTFRRYTPTLYFLDLFNEDIDERYYGSHQVAWICNDTLINLPLQWSNNIVDAQTRQNVEIPTDKKAGDFLYVIGDTAKFVTKKDIPNTDLLKVGSYYITKRGHYIVYDRDNLYSPTGVPINRQQFVPLNKYRDPDRAAADGDGSMRGSRDAYVLRLAEMYLIAAEAAIYGAEGSRGAYDILLELANARSYNGDGAEMLASYGVYGDNDITLDFLLRERARELCGEQIRWFDLKRVFTPSEFVKYIKDRNPDALYLQEFHYVRAIPQIQLDALAPEDVDLFPQNEGYN
ncbi:MAG: RagB/SusD family nutrient uptake outer membrane protein [Bacteroidales bacterium]|nr:RagB/SusD family nutrient uptake outer membrane protein [Bacteroidales bacterium]